MQYSSLKIEKKFFNCENAFWC